MHRYCIYFPIFTVALVLLRFFVHNGVALYLVWSFVASIVGLGSAIVYVDSLGKPKADLRGALFYSIIAVGFISDFFWSIQLLAK